MKAELIRAEQKGAQPGRFWQVVRHHDLQVVSAHPTAELAADKVDELAKGALNLYFIRREITPAIPHHPGEVQVTMTVVDAKALINGNQSYTEGLIGELAGIIEP